MGPNRVHGPRFREIQFRSSTDVSYGPREGGRDISRSSFPLIQIGDQIAFVPTASHVTDVISGEFSAKIRLRWLAGLTLITAASPPCQIALSACLRQR